MLPISIPTGRSETTPIVEVPWDKAVAYCQWADGRLPAEAEWEYAARGGKSGLVYPWGDEISEKHANYGGHLDGTSVVGSYPANDLGLYDMAGNVWEWCSDWYDDNYYSQSSDRDPQGPSSGKGRVLRGGSWAYNPGACVRRAVSRSLPRAGTASSDSVVPGKFFPLNSFSLFPLMGRSPRGIFLGAGGSACALAGDGCLP